MKAAIKRKWVAALRSGKYTQTTDFLFTAGAEDPQEGHCCLGVLRHCVTGKNSGHEREDGQLLDDSFLELVGLSAGAQDHLAELNDDGKSFRYIANIIEKRKTL